MSLSRIARAALSVALCLALATGARAEEPTLQWSARADSDFLTDLRFNTAGTRLTLIAEDNITLETETGAPAGPDLQGLHDLKRVSEDGQILLRLVGQGGFGKDRRDKIVLSRMGETSPLFELGPRYFGHDPQLMISRDGRFVLSTPNEHSLKGGPAFLIDTSSGTTTKLNLNEHAKPLALRQDGSALILSPGALLVISQDGTESARIPDPGWKDSVFRWFGTTASRLSEDETKLAVHEQDAETGDDLVRIYDLVAMNIEATYPLPQEHEHVTNSLAFTPNALRVALYDYSGEKHDVLVYDLQAGASPKLLWSHQGTAKYAYPVLSPDGNLLTVANSNGSLDLYNLKENAEAEPTAEKPPLPELVVGLGGLNTLSDIALSHDNRLLVTADSGGQVWLWDVASGRAIRQFGTHDNASTRFTDDGTSLTIASREKITVRDLRTGRVLREYEKSGYTPLMFAPLGRGRGYLSCHIRGCNWQPSSQEELYQAVDLPETLSGATLCAHHLILYHNTGDGYGTLHLATWDADAPTATELRQSTKFDATKITQVACASEGGAFLGTENGRVLRVNGSGDISAEARFGERAVDALAALPGESLLVGLQGRPSGLPENPAEIVALASVTLERLASTTIPLSPGGTGRNLTHLSLSPDLSRAVTVTYKSSLSEFAKSSPNNVVLWDLAAFRDRLREAPNGASLSNAPFVLGENLTSGGRLPKGIAFSPDGTHLAANFGSDTALWELATGQVTVRPDHGLGDGVKFSDTGYFTINQGDSLTFHGYDRRIETLPLPDPPEGTFGFLPTAGSIVAAGPTLAVASDEATIIWPDARTAQQPAPPYLLPAPETYSLHWRTLSPDGSRLLLQTNDTLFLQDVASPKAATRWRLTEPEDRSWRFDTTQQPAFTPDGQFILVPLSEYHSDDAHLVIDPANGEIRQSLDRGESFGAHLRPVRVATYADGPETRALLQVDGQGYATLRFSPEGDGSASIDLLGVVPVAATASPDGALLIVMGLNGKTLLWSRATGRSGILEAELFRAVAPNHTVAFSPDGKLVALLETSGAVSVFSVETGQKQAELFSFDDGSWAVVDPEGRYDATDPGNVGRLSWVMNDDPLHPIPVETFIREFYEPRLLARRISGEAFSPLSPPQERIRVTPSLEIHDISAPQTAEDGVPEVKVELRLREGIRNGEKSGLGAIKLFRDGQLVALEESLTFDGEGTARVRFDGIVLPADRREVTFSAYAFNSDGIKSATISRTHALPPLPEEKAEPRAFVIAVGVNAYDNPAWNLSYAATDAQATANVLGERLESSGRFGEVYSFALTSDPGSTGPRLAERAAIEHVLNQLGGTVPTQALPDELAAALPELPRARPQDLVYIALAGHGLAGADGRFHFFTQEFGAGTTGRTLPDDFAEHSLDSDRLSALLRGIDAREVVLVIDACNSAASVEGKGFKPGPMGSKGLGQLAYDKSMRVLAASQAEAVALESDQLRHGALTYAILREGLEAAQADRLPQNGAISIEELLLFSRDRVPQLYRGLRTGTFEPLSRGGFSVTEDEEQETLPVQQPALFDFRRETGEDVSFGAPD